jgi:hypothetical protein
MDNEKGHGIPVTAFFNTAPGLIIMLSAIRIGLGRFTVLSPVFTAMKFLLNTRMNGI